MIYVTNLQERQTRKIDDSIIYGYIEIIYFMFIREISTCGLERFIARHSVLIYNLLMHLPGIHTGP